jgi:SAM-dependent methyltransferase
VPDPAPPLPDGARRWSRTPRAGGIDALAREGFGRGAEAYERGRPAYPREAVEWVCEQLELAPHSLVVDLGAGTGKLGRLVRALSGAKVVGVEPVPEMRAIAAAAGLATLEGTAERLPAADGSTDAVFCGEAFHWFDGSRALDEIARVLGPGGGIGLLWNIHLWDPDADWVRAVEALLAPHSDGRPQTRYGSGRWRAAFELDARWAPLEQRAFLHEQRLDPAGIVDHVASVAYVAVLPEGERAALLAEVERIAGDLPDPIVIPYRTDAYTTRRAAR